MIFHIFADNDFGDLLRNLLFALDYRSNEISPNYTLESAHTNRWSLDELRETLTSLLIARAALKTWNVIAGQTEHNNGTHNEPKAEPTMEEQFEPKAEPTMEEQFEPKAEPTMEEQFEKLVSASEKDYAMYKAGNRTVFNEKDRSGGDHYDIDAALFPEMESSKTKRMLMTHVLKKARILADSKNIKFMVIIQPSSRDLTTKPALNYKHLLQHPEYNRNNLTSAVDSICLDNNIHRVNLFDLFLTNEPERLFFTAGDDHWNDAGQELAAQEVAKYIFAELLD